MVRVLVDVCVIGQGWFKEVLPDLEKIERLVFVESTDWKSLNEKQRAIQWIERLKIIQKVYGKKKVEFAPKADVEAHMRKIEECVAWCNCEECDDPHVFAIVRVKSVSFVITSEKRMDVCRKRMQGHLGQEYLSFRLINSMRNFNAHRARLVAQ